MSWIIKQRWNHVLFLNWKIDPERIRHHVPFPLDLQDGKAVLSVVPFFMDRVRFPYSPSVPLVSSLWELNLRTYVVCDGVPGIYFFCLDTPHRLGNWIARSVFGLPYRYARIHASLERDRYQLSARGIDYDLSLEAGISNEEDSSPSRQWITERYHLFLKRKDRFFRGEVIHPPWKTVRASSVLCRGRFSELAGVALPETPDSAYYARSLDVRFRPFISWKGEEPESIRSARKKTAPEGENESGL